MSIKNQIDRIYGNVYSQAQTLDNIKNALSNKGIFVSEIQEDGKTPIQKNTARLYKILDVIGRLRT